jgi:hypothetical protein
MKRETTKHGAASAVIQMKKDWIACWEKMLQRKIQEWIEAIPIHIKRVIELNGGNEYKEGRGGRRKNLDRVH